MDRNRTRLLAGVLLWSIAPHAVDAQEADSDEELVRVGWELPAAVRPGQRFTFGLRIELAPGLQDEQLVQLFRQPLDLPVQVLASAADALPGLELGAERADAGSWSLAVNDRVTRALQASDPASTEGDRIFLWLRDGVADAPQTLEFAAPRLRFARATRFRDDLLLGRVPEDREDVTVSGVAARLPVVPFPESDRPLAFVDAVGRFDVTLDVPERALAAGEALTLTVRIEGRGNLDRLTPPRLDLLEGWHVQGSGLQREEDAVVLVGALSPRTPRIRQLPPLEFAWFEPSTEDPTGGRYRTWSSDPLSIERRTSAQEDQQQPAEESRDDAAERAPGEGVGRFGWIWGVVVGLGLLGAIALLRRSKRTASATTPGTIAARPIGIDRRTLAQARGAFDGAPLDSQDACVHALRDFFAGAFGIHAADPAEVAAELRARGLSGPLAHTTEEVLAALDGARFGGGADIPEEQVRALVNSIHAAFEGGRSS